MPVTRPRVPAARAAGRRAAAIVAALPAGADAAVVRRGDDVLVGVGDGQPVVARGAEAFAVLDHLPRGLWAGFLTYELGHAVERVVPRAADEPRLPDLLLVRLGAVATVHPGGDVSVAGDGPARRALARAVASPVAPGEPCPDTPGGTWTSSLDRAGHRKGVLAVRDHLLAGDCYQVNLTRRLTYPAALDATALYARLVAHHDAPYTTLLRTHVGGDALAVVAASPECFLRLEAGHVTTRPIKGTARDREVLARSAKDRAENVMIVDLARHDVGRVCIPGSVHVPALCAVEPHPGLWHLVSTVEGTLRDDVGLGTLLRATFPPASVTGAPKPRVLQIVEDLEPVPRGVYCGAVGWIDTTGDEPEADLAVAIRTFTVRGDGDGGCARTEFGVGGGIVADSDPDGEWAETELKSERLLAVATPGAR